MGRHSAPDEPTTDDLESADTTEFSPVALDLDSFRGRHSRGDEDASESDGGVRTEADDAHTQRIAIIDDALVAPEVDEPAPARGERLAPADEPQAPPVPDKKAAKAEAARRKVDEAAAKQSAKQSAKESKKAAKGESNTRADLRLLRQSSAVRAQAVGAVIVCFLIYTVVMVVTGQTSGYLRWLWIPIVLTGFLVGLVLDLAHRRANKPKP